MKRQKLLKHLRSHNCEQLREGGNHSIWINTEFKTRSIVPRHREIVDQLAKRICKELGIPSI